MNKSIKDTCGKKREVEKEKIEIRPTVFFVFDIINYYLIKDKATFVKLMCRNNTSSKPIKVNNYQVHAKKFDHGTAPQMYYYYTTKYRELSSSRNHVKILSQNYQ